MPEDRPLRSFNVQMMRPTAAGAVEGRFRVVRQGRSATFAEVRLAQSGETTLTANLVFASQRPEATAVVPAVLRLAVRPESIPLPTFRHERMPEFLQHCEMKWAEGGPPFTSATEASFAGYCRFRGPAADVEAIMGLMDMWPCPTLSVLSQPAFASTMTWSGHVLAVPASFDGWFTFSCKTVAGEGGLHTIVGHLHGPDGELVGWTEQLVAVFG